MRLIRQNAIENLSILLNQYSASSNTCHIEVAKSLNISRSSFTEYCNYYGKLPNINTICSITDLLNISIDDLLALNFLKKIKMEKCFYTNVKTLCKHSNKSLRQLAREIGISQHALQNILSRKIIPKSYTVILIAVYFNISVDSIVGDTFNKKENN